MRITISILLALALSGTAMAQRLNYDALVRSAKIYLNQTPKDYDMAELRLKQAIEQYPDEPPVEAHTLLGELQAERGRYAEMVVNFDKADSICANATDSKVERKCEKERIQERTADVRQSVWIDEFNEGAQNLSEAKEYGEELEEIEDEEEKAEVLEEIEAIYRLALENFMNATTITPDSAQGWINQGITYYRLSTDYEEMGLENADHIRALKDSSIASYKTALDMHPDNFDLLSNLSTIYFELENWQECSNVFGKMAGLQPDNATILQNLAMLLLQLGMKDSASVITDKVLEIDPQNQELRMRRGYMEIDHGMAINDSINELKEQDEAGNKAEIERLTEARNEAYRSVVEDLSVVTEVDPGNYDAWYFLGFHNFLLENYEAARDAWEKAAEADPTKVDPWERLAPLYLRLGQRDKSREAEAKIAELKGD